MNTLRLDGRRLKDLTPTRRKALTHACYALWDTYFVGLSYEKFMASQFTENTWLHTAWNAEGQLVGFYNLTAMPMTIRGKSICIFLSALVTRLGSGATKPLVNDGFSRFIRARIRMPFTRVAYVSAAWSPFSYRRASLHAHILYPRDTVPKWVREAVKDVNQARGFKQGAHPFLVSGFKLRSSPHLEATLHRFAQDPGIQYYIHQNPNWLGGNALIIWYPASPTNLMRSALNLLRYQVR